jgi:hypothetical protein
MPEQPASQVIARTRRCGVHEVKLSAWRDDDMAAGFSESQVHAEHGSVPLHRSKAGSRPSG